VMRAGPSTVADLPLLMLGGSGDLALYARDNIAVDRIGRALPQFGRYTTSAAQLIVLKQAPEVPDSASPLGAIAVQDAVIRDVGARPWDRDAHDARIVADTIEGRGKIIDGEDEVGGYPHDSATAKAFDPDEWDLSTMTPLRPVTERRRPH